MIYLIGILHLLIGVAFTPVMLLLSIFAQFYHLLSKLLSLVVQQRSKTQYISKQSNTVDSQRDPIFSILITGASSGIGRALVLNYANSPPANKTVCFGLLGTRSTALEELTHQLMSEYDIPLEQIFWQAIDIRDEEAMKNYIKEFEFRFEGMPDVLVANAGVVEYTLRRNDSNMLVGDMHKRIWDINFQGMLNTVSPIVDDLLATKTVGRGSSSNNRTVNQRSHHTRICIVSAMASIIPSTSFYALCKKAMVDYAHHLRWILAGKATVTVVIPGFVDTEMVEAYKGSKPMMVSAATAANNIRNSIDRGDSECVFPRLVSLIFQVCSVLPPILSEPVMRLIPYTKV